MIAAARDGFVFGQKADTNTLPPKIAHILPLHVRNTLLQVWQKPALKKGVTGLAACPKKGRSKTDTACPPSSHPLVALFALEKRKETSFDE